VEGVKGYFQEAAKNPRKAFREGAKGAGDVLALGGGFLPGLAKFPAIAIGRLVSELAESGANPAEVGGSVAQDVLLEAVLGGIPGVGLAKTGGRAWRGIGGEAPEALTALGLRVGGAKDPEVIAEAARGITNEWRRGRPLLPGNELAVRRRLDVLGDQARAIEARSPARFHIDDIADEAEQQAIKRLNRVGPTSPQSDTQAAIEQIERFADENRAVAGGPWLNAEQTGDIKRAQAKLGLDLPGSIHEPSPVSKVVSRALSKSARGLEDVDVPDIVPLNKRMADLYGAQRGNEAVRGNTSWFSPTRAVKGAGLGMSAGTLMGFPLQEGATAGVIASSLLANPKALTVLGQVGGPAAGLTPSAARLMELIEGLDEDPEEVIF
jgi:hypothetical protein